MITTTKTYHYHFYLIIFHTLLHIYQDYSKEISFQFIRVMYDIDKELKDKDISIDKEDYEYELKNGML